MDRISKALNDLERLRDVGIINAKSDKAALQKVIDLVKDLRERVEVLEERLAIMQEDQPGADTSFDPPYNEPEDQDYWDGTWPEIRGR